MSTKIYNGFVLPFMTLTELNEFSKNFREKVKKATMEQAEKLHARRIASKLDQLCLLDEETFVERHLKEDEKSMKSAYRKYELLSPSDDQYYEAYDRYQEVQRTHCRDGEVDFDASVVYIPLEDKILALFFGEQDVVKKLWEQEENVSYYGYWNNTDQDEDCTEKEWEQRGIDWEKALPGYTTPMDAGIIAEFVKGYPSKMEFSETNILSLIDSPKTRAERWAKGQLENKKFKELEASGEKRGYEIVMMTREWLETEEGKIELAALTEEIEAKLIPEITSKHLVFSYKEIKNELLN